MKKMLALVCLGLLLLLPLGFLSLMNSVNGSRWLIQKVLAFLPAETSIANIEGNLLGNLQLNQLRYESAEERITIDHVQLAWQPKQLLSGHLKIVAFDLDGVNFVIKQKSPSKPSQFDWNADFMPPLQVTLDKFSISNLQYQDGDNSPLNLQKLTLSASSEHDLLIVKSLTIEATALEANASGQIQLGRQFPFILETKWQYRSTDYGQWQEITQLKGDAKQVKINHQQASPFALNLVGQMDNLQSKPVIKLRGEWQKLSWPIQTAQPQVSSAQGAFEINGPLDDYQLSLNGPLTQNYLPGANLNFKGKGSSSALNIEALQIASDVGFLKINGNVDWQSDPSLVLNINARQFNPAIFMPELAGKLTFDSQITGQQKKPSPEIQFTLNSLTGQLRGSPIEAAGKLAMTAETYSIDHLKINSGRNHINANGLLSKAQSNLALNIDAPVLAVFWPGLSGNLKASGNIQGNWQNPNILFQAKGNQLQFASHKIDQLAIDLDYQPDSHKVSKLQLSANKIKTGDIAIASINLNGAGGLPQHQFSLEFKSPLANISSTLTGSMVEQNWQGNLNQLSLNGPSWGAWQLQSPSKIQATQQNQGYDVHVSGFCLVQRNSSLCTNSQFQANSDFKLQLKAVSLPNDLLQPFLPSQLQITGLMDAEADLQQQKGLLSGNYGLSMPTSSVILKDGKKSRELALGQVHLLGQLKNNLLSSDADLGLTHNDFVRAKLQLNTQSKNNLSAQINASITEWDLIQPFIPGVNELSGQLTANLNLHGNLASPLLSGQINLNNGGLEITDAGIALKQIDLQAQASSGKYNHILLNGSANPVLSPNPNAHQIMQFDGRLAFSAELEQINSQIRGRYHLDIPANSHLIFKNDKTAIEAPFAASSVSGDINGAAFSANLELLMLNQDFLRAKLQADAGKSQNLSGNIQASMLDLTLFNALIPQVSDIKGQLNADLSLQGTISQPVAQGSLQLLEGAANVPDLGIALQDIHLQLSNSALKDEHLVLTGKVKSGEGQLNIHGLVHLNGNADITLQGADFEVAKLPEAQIAISPDLKLALTESGGKASGQLQIPKAMIVMEDLPQNAVKVSEDEVIVGQNNADTTPNIDNDWGINIDVILGNKVSFSGQGLNTELNGRLKIGKTEDKTSLHGTIDMKNGRYKSYGQDLTVRKGRFMFDGPIDSPWLDVEAIRVSKEQDVTAILSLSGPLKSPKTRIYSEPALPEAEALAYLMTGSTLNQVSKADGGMVAGAALSYGVGKLSWLTEKLGIDEFEVKEGKTLNDTLLSMGEYLTEDFYIGTKIGIFDKQAMLVLRHNLTKSLKVETQAGTSQRVKLNYEIDTD